MKKTTGILLFTALLVLSMLFTGCPKEVDTVSVSERMSMFILDANAYSYGNLKAHTHPDATAYNGADSVYWNNFFNDEADLPLSLVSISSNTATVAGGAYIFTFTLQEDDKDVFKIRTITASSHTTFN